MPYLLTANPPGSPSSWVRMETDSVRSGQSDYGVLPPAISGPHRSNGPQANIPTTTSRGTRALPPTFTLPTLKHSNYANTNLVHNNSMQGISGMQQHSNLMVANAGFNLTAGHASSTPPLTSPTSILSNYSFQRNPNPLDYGTSHQDMHMLSGLSNSPSNYNQIDSSPNNQPNSFLHGSHQRFDIYPNASNLQARNNDYQSHHQLSAKANNLQDQDWGGESTTGIAGLSDLGLPPEPLIKWGLDQNSNSSSTEGEYFTWDFMARRYAGAWAVFVVAVLAFLSPILMVILPQLEVLELREGQLRCDVECDGTLISFTLKLLLLLLATWAIFFRQTKSTLPRIHLFRTFIGIVLVVMTITFWLFYVVRLTGEQRRRVQYFDIVQFSSSMVDSLLFVQYLAVLFIELRHLNPEFYIKVVRSPDGESKSYAIGNLSIQRAAAWVLEKYYTDFPIYNPYLEKIPVGGIQVKPSANGGLKRNVNPYDLSNGVTDPLDKDNFSAHAAAASPLLRSGMNSQSHFNTKSQLNDRVYEENDYDRRLQKRKFKLISATEEAFAHVKRLNDQKSKTPSSPIECQEAAQAIFPGIARPLQKFLRITRQQPRHTMQSILDHLANSLKYQQSPKAFLEKFLVPSPVLQNDMDKKQVQDWSLISDNLLSRPIKSGTVFQLRQGDVSLLCQIEALPHFSIIEEVIDVASNKFLLRTNPETPV